MGIVQPHQAMRFYATLLILSKDCSIAAKDLADYERIRKEWLLAMPHVLRINSSFALRGVVDLTAIGGEGGDLRGVAKGGKIGDSLLGLHYRA
jgi:hypothetical protein